MAFFGFGLCTPHAAGDTPAWRNASAGNAPKCDKCKAGRYATEQRDQCLGCAENTFSLSGSELADSCTLCDAGWFAPAASVFR